MAESTQVFTDLIAVLRDGEAFYREAIKAIDDPVLIKLFRAMLKERTDAIAELQKKLAKMDAEPDEEGTIVGEIRQEFAQIRAMMQGPEHAYIAELLKLELRTLDKIDECFTAAPTAEEKAFLRDMWERFRSTADSMQGMWVSRRD